MEIKIETQHDIKVNDTNLLICSGLCPYMLSGCTEYSCTLNGGWFKLKREEFNYFRCPKCLDAKVITKELKKDVKI